MISPKTNFGGRLAVAVAVAILTRCYAVYRGGAIDNEIDSDWEMLTPAELRESPSHIWRAIKFADSSFKIDVS
jgi:hypothetical protein